VAGDKGYVFSLIVNDLNLICCDNLDLENIGFTYFHDTLGHKSFIDHFFVHRELLPLISYFKILENGANVSDHLPIALCLAVPVVKCDETALSDSFVHIFLCDKGDITNYYEQTGLLLNNIAHDFSCMQCDFNCSNKDCHVDIDILQ